MSLRRGYGGGLCGLLDETSQRGVIHKSELKKRLEYRIRELGRLS